MLAKISRRNAVLALTSSLGLSAALSGAALAGGFTAEQAEAGGKAYQANCAQCHGVRLEGPEAPGLFGQDVMGNWDSAGGLFDFISVAMPPSAPGQLGTEAYVNMVAYIMQQNGAEPGDTPMPDDSDALYEISLVAETKAGAAAMASSAGAATDAPDTNVPQAYTWGKELPQFTK